MNISYQWNSFFFKSGTIRIFIAFSAILFLFGCQDSPIGTGNKDLALHVYLTNQTGKQVYSYIDLHGDGSFMQRDSAYINIGGTNSFILDCGKAIGNDTLSLAEVLELFDEITILSDYKGDTLFTKADFDESCFMIMRPDGEKPIHVLRIKN